MKILITGAAGQLGQDLSRALTARNPIARTHAELDIGDEAAVTAAVRDLGFDVILNAAADNHVDRAEDDPLPALRANALGPRALARACAATGALLVHFSTDYVFGAGAATPRFEEDPPTPRGAYAISKLAGELFVRSTAPRHLVIRTSGLYGHHGRGGKGGNFVETMLRLAGEGKKIRVVSDQVLTPTFTEDLAAIVARLLELWEEKRSPDLLGLYHATNGGSCSWYEFAAEIFRQSGIWADLDPISTADYGAKAPRPPYCVLACGHLQRVGLSPLRPWRNALTTYLGT